jgi:type I restriction enzyme, S subunit
MMSTRPSAESESLGQPPGWGRASLRELCTKAAFLDPVKIPEREFDYVDVSSVSAERLKILGTAKVKGAAAPSRARKLVRAGDVIFATVRPALRRVALVPPELDGQLASTAFCVIRANPEIADPRFLYYASITDEFVQRVGALQRGASYPAVTDGNVMDQEILIPPLPEQRAIAGVLSKLQSAVELQDRIVAALKELKAATMAKLFREGLRGEPLKQTEIGEIPKSWGVVSIGTLFAIQQGKALSPGARRGLRPRPFLRTANVLWGSLDLTNLDSMDFGPAEASRLSLVPGDLLVCEGGEIGRTAIWELCATNHSFQNHIHRLRRRSDSTEPAFFMYWMEHAFLGRHLYSGQGNRTTIPNLSGSRLAGLLIPLPGNDEQRNIASALGVTSESAVQAQAKLTARQRLFECVLDSLMTGRVRARAL